MKKRSILLFLVVLSPAAFGYKTTTHVDITHDVKAKMAREAVSVETAQ